jgi:hypothetical protein
MRIGDLWFNENTKGERKKQMKISIYFPHTPNRQRTGGREGWPAGIMQNVGPLLL